VVTGGQVGAEPDPALGGGLGVLLVRGGEHDRRVQVHHRDPLSSRPATVSHGNPSGRAASSPHQCRRNGEGAPLYAAGLGTVSLIPLPTYLLQAGDAQYPEQLALDKLDKSLMYGQILTSANTIETLDHTQVSAL
jgi:hypothetical protein